MDRLKILFDYQRFSPNKRLEKQIDAVYTCYCSSAQRISDDQLDLAAAGEPYTRMDEVEKDDLS